MLDLQKNCEDSVDSSPIPHTQFPCYQYLLLYSTFTTTVESLLIVKVHTSFICPQFSPHVLFLFQCPLQDIMLHLIVMSP